MFHSGVPMLTTRQLQPRRSFHKYLDLKRSHNLFEGPPVKATERLRQSFFWFLFFWLSMSHPGLLFCWEQNIINLAARSWGLIFLFILFHFLFFFLMYLTNILHIYENEREQKEELHHSAEQHNEDHFLQMTASYMRIPLLIRWKVQFPPRLNLAAAQDAEL